jgi:Relaxase/Mobilisation nuclease domain/Large polyvalent protein-associated domain 7
MIAKHVPMKSVKKSDFVSLVNYLVDAQEKNERVAYTSVTNCASIDVNAAVIEVTATQGMNTRAESDKTYHLILSFRAGERPDDSILAAIESKICEGLGYGEHQRVSVAHDDTDNFHLHIAINKIHPTRLTIHSPYNDHKTLGKLCAALELQYGLEQDNHQAVRVGSENRALDMEHHAGVESLLGWIQRECLEQLQSACCWAELHRVLQEHGLELKERGYGLVISDQNGLMVKASSIDRELSKAKLVDRFGEFTSQPRPVNTEGPGKRYEARPVRSRIDTTLLFARYKKEQQGRSTNRTQGFKDARAKRDRLMAELKRKATLKRAATKLAGGSRSEKKLLFAMTSQSVKGELNKINEQYRLERERLLKQYQPLQWADWLRRAATNGDQEALAALRARVAAYGLKGNTISARGGALQRTGVKAAQDGITKKGTIIYCVGASAVRDDGDRLKVSRGATREGLEAALRLAMERYGTHITVNGTAEFKAHIVEVAATAKLCVTFADATLERKRASLVNLATLVPHSFAAVDQYIAEREQKRLKILDIMEHRRYTIDDLGVASFAGVRRIEGEALALLKRDQVILVMPIDDKTANRLSRLSIGDQVTCTGIGIVKTKGRSR